MDIFTTVLTKVRPTPIKPEKLRVKSLTKDAATREIDEESGQLEEYAFYKALEKGAKQDSKNSGKSDTTQFKKASPEREIEPEEPAILHKHDITQPKKVHTQDKDDDEAEHLDIYV